MMTIEPRLADRRREVAEDRARRNIGRLLRLLVGLTLIASIVWLFLSPSLSVANIEVAGVHTSDATTIITNNDIVAGRPMILIRPGIVEAALLEDPWVKDADVELDWPNTVVIEIVERTPVAWVQTGGGWAQRAIDGVALPGLTEPDETMGRVVLPDVSDALVEEDDAVLGALEFLDELPVALSSNAVVEARDGELWAQVGGFEVRLGRPAEMSDKARSLATLLTQNLAAGSVINMIAPTNPAVTPPANGGPDDGEEGGAASDQEEGTTEP